MINPFARIPLAFAAGLSLFAGATAAEPTHLGESYTTPENRNWTVQYQSRRNAFISPRGVARKPDKIIRALRSGRNNSAAATQASTGNRVTVVQTGDRNSAQVRQRGNNKTAYVAQTGDDTDVIVRQRGKSAGGVLVYTW